MEKKYRWKIHKLVLDIFNENGINGVYEKEEETTKNCTKKFAGKLRE